MTSHPRRPPVQFGLATILTVTTAVAALLGLLKWMDVSPVGMAVVLGVALLGGAGAVGLVLALAAAVRGEEPDPRDDDARPPEATP